MKSGERFHVYAEPNESDSRESDPRAHSGEEPPKRGEVVREFMEIARVHGFEQYPRLAAAYNELQIALDALGFSGEEQATLFEETLKKFEDPKFTRETGEMGVMLREEIIYYVSKKLGELQKQDHILLVPLEKAMRTFYIRNLEILATFQKQEREHTASHRAHSSREDGEYIFGGPELSLEAIRGALEQGVKTIELDVVALQDGTPVVSHGLRTKTREGTQNLRDIPNLDVARETRATIDRTETPIYGLAELFDAFEPYRGLAKLNLEIKDNGSVSQIIQLIRERNLENEIIISAFNPRSLLTVHEALPTVQIGVNVFVNELNANTILEKSFPKEQPIILPGNIALGGTELPPDGKRDLFAAHYRTLPQELRDMLIKTKGYLSVQLPSAKLGFTSQLKKLQEQASKEGIQLLMFRVPSGRVQTLRKHIDLLHLDEGEKVTYGRMRRKP